MKTRGLSQQGRQPRTGVFCAALALAAAGAAMSAPQEGPAALRARLDSLRPALQHSPFGRPLVLQANDSDEAPQGDVWAVLDHPISQVVDILRSPAAWCEALLLQTNVKRCSVQGNEVLVGMTRKYTDPADTARTMSFRWSLRDASSDHLDVALGSPEGLLGTSDYRLRFEAVPAGEGRSFVHLSYAYRMGTAARMASSLYFSTSGRDKVGFSIVGRDGEGRPQYVGGIRGVAERNTMRTFLALDSTLATEELPPGSRLQARLRSFHDALERYPAQLHETGLGEYMALKAHEGRPS